MLRPFFRYYGSKWGLSRRYPAPSFPMIVEPFAGGAGYALHHPERRVTLFDTDPKVIGVWKYLINVSDAEIRALPVDVDHVDDLVGCSAESKWLVGFWFNPGSNGPRLSRSKWVRGHGSQLHKWCRGWGVAVRERIASQLPFIRHWVAVEASYTAAADWEATWFIDPPYQSAAGRVYRHNDVDYPRLAEWTRSRRGQLIVCESAGADWLPFQPLVEVRNQTKAKTTEMIWTRGSDYATAI